MRYAIAVFVASVALDGGVQADGPAKVDLGQLPPAAARRVDFAKDVRPIFQAACVECHGPTKQRSGLRLDVAQAAFEGSDSGAVLVPKDVAKSRLLHVVAGLDPEATMPPKGKPPLTREQIGVLRAWIEQGAVWPNDATPIAKAKSDHWAFQPLRSAPEATGKTTYEAIDQFVRARLAKEKLAPAPEADRVTLIRRVSFDLTGLPPTPEEVARFVDDASPDAYAAMVDRFLASPHYGERWARHWLDLARYADSDGYEQDRPRPFAFRYRDWVIDALNRGQPFDAFALEQLAGDLLPNATLAQKTATGFHRNTLTNREGGTDKEQFRVEAVVDRVNTTFKAFFGLTMNCAQCHDHKYDPLSQREFYRVFAFFNSDDEVDLPSPLPDDVKVFASTQKAFEKKKAEFEKAIAVRKAQLEKAAYEWERTKKTDPAGPPSRTAYFEQSLKTDAAFLDATKKLADHLKKAPAKAIVPTLALGKGRKTHVLIRGDFLRPGVAVAPGTPESLHPLKAPGTPTRLDFARWVVSPDNPLTPRVIVNWVWQKHFGRGLVHTLEDFGTQGERPSHPELLDALAADFQKTWSLKDLHRSILRSATYRQESRTRPELIQRDPLNVLLARQSRLRLDAEVLRDNALAVSGLLHPKVGGPSVKPPQPAGISELTYANAARWVESQGPDRYRRGMYTWFQRTSPYPMLAMFDAPDGTLCCVRRERTNTPLQALTLMNDATFVECAQGLARRIAAREGTLDERVAWAFRLTLGRAPRPEEASAVRDFYADAERLAPRDAKTRDRLVGPVPAGLRSDELAAWVAVGRLLLNLDEAVTRE